ncbi:MAG: DNA polymerase ligase N-terminal domain-containing protein [Methanosarcinales archaeon]|nr:3'-phosphoesterase [ANME-2 cluster archaeon]MDF1530923.1 DNA polymerase ligase N-terminal domain-containing protein [ANME-2 cluster archaeon]MDW7775132.1 DNA polymerase ligase N-terminal domain-containing protein [Methanosarcinales archaeon]
MNLVEYKNNRDFTTTDEPDGTNSIAEGITQGSIYVIQEHDSKKLHYDLRLQFGGVLRSWAVPKEPPEKPGVKRLAIPTEDHPLAYARFEGEIPEGHYGAGTVKIWDKGIFEPLEVDEEKIIFRIEGRRLSGVYCLIKTRGQGKKEQWLFFRKNE